MTTNIHASCIFVHNQGVLLLGASGRGKSDLCLRLITSHQAWLVADDRVDLVVEDGQVLASAPANIKGMLEVRGVGLLKMESLDNVPVRLVVELTTARDKIERLPVPQFYRYENLQIPKIDLYPFDASAPDKIIAALMLLDQN